MITTISVFCPLYEVECIHKVAYVNMQCLEDYKPVWSIAKIDRISNQQYSCCYASDCKFEKVLRNTVYEK